MSACGQLIVEFLFSPITISSLHPQCCVRILCVCILGKCLHMHSSQSNVVAFQIVILLLKVKNITGCFLLTNYKLCLFALENSFVISFFICKTSSSAVKLACD